jgi:hypothetical protein
MFGFRLYSRARHPLARLLALIVGAAVLLVVLAFGFFAALALAIGGAAVVLFNALRTPQQHRSAHTAAAATTAAPAPAGVIEGEFKVVRETPVRR